ncbi:hypothetical protein ACFE04_016230 [Oxalis oulophora]
MFIMLSLNNQGGVIDRKLDVVETCKLQSRFIKKKVTVFHLEISKKWSHEDLKRVRWMLNSENKRGVLESGCFHNSSSKKTENVRQVSMMFNFKNQGRALARILKVVE